VGNRGGSNINVDQKKKANGRLCEKGGVISTKPGALGKEKRKKEEKRNSKSSVVGKSGNNLGVIQR